MDPFASYAALDNPQHFWAELDEILDTPFQPPQSSASSASHHPSYASSSTQHAHAHADHDVEALLQAKRIYVASILAKFLHLCAASFNDNLTSEYNQNYCIDRLFSSTAFRDDADPDPALQHNASNIAMHQVAAEESIRIMQTSTSIPVLLMTYEIVLQYGDAFPATYKSIQASASTVSFVGVRAFLHRLVHQIWAGSYAAQAEAKIGISDQQTPVGWNGASWNAESQAPSAASSSQPSQNAPSYVSRGLTTSSASKEIAVQISLREKAVRMLYEVCRVQKLEPGHLKAFDERFIHHLFDLVEETRHHHDEDFNYRLIKLLVAMNEQYMVSTLTSSAPAHSATTPGQINSAPPASSRPVNLVLSVLQQRLNASKTFGENLIFMLNRASSSDAEDVCMQLLVLKLLYLLFTTKETACYFYTNDLRVLVDIFIRELHDLPDESESLRHTYLRVLHPLLTNTQLCTYPYKRPQIRRLLNGLVAHGHLRDISATTKRLVDRCLRAEWCVELDRLDGSERVAKVEPIGGGETHVKTMQPGVTTEGLPMLATKIKENSNSVQATADSLAITTEDEVASPISISTTLSPTSTDSVFDSVPERSHSGSLSVPSTLRTRDKRVASLSHPRSLAEDGNALLRPNSAASLSSSSAGIKHHHHHHQQQHHNRRAVSAQSAPCTPPRVDSPSLLISSRQNSRLSELSSPIDGADADDAMSTSSSWHAHMLEDPPTESGKQQQQQEQQERRQQQQQDGYHHSRDELATGVGAGHLSIGPHLYQAVESSAAVPRVGSPLSSESTMQILEAGAKHVAEGSDSTVMPTPLSGGGGLGREAVLMSSTHSTASSSAGEPPKRRKPPQPPSQTARRTLQLSSSEPHFSGGGGGGAMSLSSTTSSVMGGSRSSSPYGSISSSPANEDPAATTGGGSGGGGHPFGFSKSSSLSSASVCGNSGGSGGRRRPPPPPPPPASTAASSHTHPSSSAAAADAEGEGEGEAIEDELANAQSFYIAERLRRGLRIR